jgi:hypothetical protein
MPATKEVGERSKRIIVCCDGTASSAYSEKPFTNVSRISRCIKSVTSVGSPQIVHYVPGIGTGDSNPLNLWNQGVGIGRYLPPKPLMDQNPPPVNTVMNNRLDF